jgi:hypothetical protein
MEISIEYVGYFLNLKITGNTSGSNLAKGQVNELEATLVRVILFLVKFKLYTPWIDYVIEIRYSVIIKGLMNEYMGNNNNSKVFSQVNYKF